MILLGFWGKSELGWWNWRHEDEKVRALHSCGREQEGFEVYMCVCLYMCGCVFVCRILNFGEWVLGRFWKVCVIQFEDVGLLDIW